MGREYTAKEAFAELKAKYSGDEENKISPIKAIRAKCLDCCCGQTNEVLLCTCTDCPLYVFRFGKNPFTNRTLTEEQKIAAGERMKKWRNKMNEDEDMDDVDDDGDMNDDVD